MFRPYLCVLSTPRLTLPFICTFLGALPIGMLGLSEFLLVQSTTGSFAQAGTVSGAVTAGNAVGLVVQGRLIDRHGQSVVLIPAGLVCGSSLVLLTVVALAHGPYPLLVALAAVAGAGIPAVTASMRVLIPDLLAAPGMRLAAYALLGTQFQLAMVSGPLVVSVVLTLATPGVAVLLAAVAATVSGLAFGATRASRGWRASGHVGPTRRRLALLTPGFRTLLVVAFAAGLSSGLAAVAVPTAAIARHAAPFAGVLFAAASVGDVVGGLGYGARAWPARLSAQLACCLAGCAVVSGLLATAAGHPHAMVVLMFAAGMAQAPGGVATSSLLDHVAASGFLGRSYTTMVATSLVGIAAGNAMGGALTDATDGIGGSLLFAAAAAMTAVAAALTLVRRQTLG